MQDFRYGKIVKPQARCFRHRALPCASCSTSPASLYAASSHLVCANLGGSCFAVGCITPHRLMPPLSSFQADASRLGLVQVLGGKELMGVDPGDRPRVKPKWRASPFLSMASVLGHERARGTLSEKAAWLFTNGPTRLVHFRSCSERKTKPPIALSHPNRNS